MSAEVQAETKKDKGAGLVTLWLGPELKDGFKQTCQARGYSQSMIARMLFGQWLSRQPKKIKKKSAA